VQELVHGAFESAPPQRAGVAGRTLTTEMNIGRQDR